MSHAKRQRINNELPLIIVLRYLESVRKGQVKRKSSQAERKKRGEPDVRA